MLITQVIDRGIQAGRPVITGLAADGVAEIGATVGVLLNGEIPSGAVEWRLDGIAIPGATATSLQVPDSEDGALGVAAAGRVSAAARILHPAPVATGPLPDQVFDQGTGDHMRAAAPGFAFAGTALYTLTAAPQGASIDGTTGLVTFATGTLAPMASVPVVVRAADSLAPARFAETGFALTVNAVASAPEAFAPADWDIADDMTGGDATLTVTGLPDDGGSPLTALEIRIAGGAWMALSAPAPGAYALDDLFTDGTPTEVELRAVNAEGAGPAGPGKSVTTSAPAPGAWSITDHGDGSFSVAAAPSAEAAPDVAGHGDGTFDVAA